MIFVVVTIVLAKALSVEPEGDERFGRLGAWDSTLRAYATAHPR
jgi:hypothetical protein